MALGSTRLVRSPGRWCMLARTGNYLPSGVYGTEADDGRTPLTHIKARAARVVQCRGVIGVLQAPRRAPRACSIAAAGTVNAMPIDFEDWIDITTAAWLAPFLATVEMLETMRLAVAPASPGPDVKPGSFEVPCADEELFA